MTITIPQTAVSHMCLLSQAVSFHQGLLISSSAHKGTCSHSLSLSLSHPPPPLTHNQHHTTTPTTHNNTKRHVLHPSSSLPLPPPPHTHTHTHTHTYTHTHTHMPHCIRGVRGRRDLPFLAYRQSDSNTGLRNTRRAC